MVDRLAKLRHVVLDMDGTIYLGHRLFPETLPFLATLRELGIGYSFVTNNCSLSRGEYVAHLRDLGIEAPPDSVVTSIHATIHHLRTELPKTRRLFVLSSPGSCDDLRREGYEIVAESPDAVLVGFDLELTYEKLCRTAYFIKQGLPYIATHPDRVCPTDKPTVLPDCAAICALLETATGRKPDAIPGKPAATMLQGVLARHNVTAGETAMIGDRLYTDVRMARDAGVLAVLTLTGEANAEEAVSLPESQRPDLIINNLAELEQQLRVARAT
jgi:HAD superfamily hydrolase (TIGR01450 family)